jgi:hypothetical protein
MKSIQILNWMYLNLLSNNRKYYSEEGLIIRIVKHNIFKSGDKVTISKT